MKSGNRIMKPKIETKKSKSNKSRSKKWRAKKSKAKKAQPTQPEPPKSTSTPQEPSKDEQPEPLQPSGPIGGTCFETIGFIVGNGNCTEVRHMLVDTGADSSFINMRAVHAANLNINQIPPVRFSTNNGSITRDKYVSFTLCLGGIRHTVDAYVVEEEDDGLELLLGMAEFETFRMTVHAAAIGKDEVKVSVKSNVPGKRHQLIYLHRDDSEDDDPALVVHSNTSKGLQRARRLGETGKQRKARRYLERKNAELKVAEQECRRLEPTWRGGRARRVVDPEEQFKARQNRKHKEALVQKAEKAWRKVRSP